MQFKLLSKYIFDYIPFFFIYSELISLSNMVVFLHSAFIHYYIIFLKNSFFFKNIFLLDMGIFEIPVFQKDKNLIFRNTAWYIFKNISNNYLYLFSILENNNCKSIELLFRNAKWLERENSEFFDVYYENKTDRRSLFTIPVFYEAPFKKKFPTVGFYEIFSCFLTKKIKFKHISFRN